MPHRLFSKLSSATLDAASDLNNQSSSTGTQGPSEEESVKNVGYLLLGVFIFEFCLIGLILLTNKFSSEEPIPAKKNLALKKHKAKARPQRQDSPTDDFFAEPVRPRLNEEKKELTPEEKLTLEEEYRNRLESQKRIPQKKGGGRTLTAWKPAPPPAAPARRHDNPLEEIEFTEIPYQSLNP